MLLVPGITCTVRVKCKYCVYDMYDDSLLSGSFFRFGKQQQTHPGPCFVFEGLWGIPSFQGVALVMSYSVCVCVCVCYNV